MPDFKFEPVPTERLFPEDDPLTLTLPGVGTFELLDRANPPVEDHINPTERPVAYVLEVLAVQVVEHERDDFKREMVAAVKQNRVMVATLLDVARWITDQRQEAETAATARSVKRPTKGARRSTSS